MKRLILLLAVIPLVACQAPPSSNPSPPPSEGQKISATVLSAAGFEGGPSIVASSSLTRLIEEIHAAGASPSADLCAKAAADPNYGQTYATSCWTAVSAPADTLFIATRIYQPCATSRFFSASMTPPARLIITVTTRLGCGPGSASQPTSYLSLIAVPLALLPHAVVTVEQHRYVNGVPAPWWWDGATLVDLRDPQATSPDSEPIAVDLHRLLVITGVASALSNIGFTGLARVRWSPESACDGLAVPGGATGMTVWLIAITGWPAGSHTTVTRTYFSTDQGPPEALNCQVPLGLVDWPGYLDGRHR